MKGNECFHDRNKFLTGIYGGGLAAVLGAIIPLPAHGQEGLTLQEIVVTASRREQSLQNVPMAVSAISGSELTAQGIFETSDLNRSAPNFQVSGPYGTQQPNFTLRGIGVGTEYNANTASPVGVYVDEVYQTFRASHGQQLYDLEQVEIMRGPQGTLFGRNTTGGAVNFITRKPELEGVNGRLSVGFGNYDRKSAEGAIEFTPVEGVFGIRLAGTYVETDPYVDNKLPAGLNTVAADGASGTNFNTGISPGGRENYGVRATFRFLPSDNVDLSLKVYDAESDGGNEAPIPTGTSRATDTINYTDPNFILAPFFEANSDLLPSSYTPRNDPYEVEADTLGRSLVSARGAVFNARVGITDAWSFIGMLGYDEGKSLIRPADCDGTPLPICNSSYDSEFDAVNLDLRMEYQGDRLNLTAGAYYGEDTLEQDDDHDFFGFFRDLNVANGLASNFWNPAGLFLPGLPGTAFTATQEYEQYRDSWALYGEAVYAFTDSVNVTFGLRYSDDTIEFRDGISRILDNNRTPRVISVSDFTVAGEPALYFLEGLNAPDGSLIAPADVLNGGAPLPGPLNESDDSDEISGRIIVDWQMNDNLMVYGSYSRGYRAASINGSAYSTPGQIYAVPPEEVDAYEVGFKSNFVDDRLELNGAFFYYDYTGQQARVIDTNVIGSLVSLDGELTGAELEARFAAADNLSLSASVGWLDSEYDSANCPDEPISGFPPHQGNCVVTVKGDASVGGNPFPFAADWTFNAAFDWDIATFGAGTLRLHGDAAYTGQYYYDPFGDHDKGILPDVSSGKFSEGEGEYWVYNARLSYTSGNYIIALWGKNLSDEEYYPFGVSTEAIFSSGYRVIAPPRTYGMEIQYSF